MYLFSPATRGIYLPELHGNQIPKDAINLNDSEYDALISNPAPHTMLRFNPTGLPERIHYNDASQDALARSWRDVELQRTQWMVDRHRDEIETAGTIVTLSKAVFEELLSYRQSLRDWPEKEGFPEVEKRPVRSSSIDALFVEQAEKRSR
ncbi:phage tail assembly chaperone [Pseudomonas viridiflava]|uniref:phage tail assembly chaperone n=1 Tax=Pseudomonas viridiflava TaxID=33069 RepID=UPI001F621B80|nr:phage tail assembly chaperone [Pseudomonas viridiflava]MCI3908844.1 phage tail assembly chaperone [Pseudomonas viridiflava]